MKKIKFRPTSIESELVVEKPKPTKLYVPDWFKKTPKFYNNKFSVDEKSGLSNSTIKQCMPFLDALTSGYIQETWCDIFVEKSNFGIKYHWSMNPQIIKTRTQKSHFPSIDGFLLDEFVWNQPWIPQVPKGYSILYTHPLNRYDLPFLSLSGIIDNDSFYMEGTTAEHPFFIKNNFEGIIPAGTPMFQMIPIKRESWLAEYFSFDELLSMSFQKTRKYFYSSYKKMFWQKKEYF